VLRSLGLAILLAALAYATPGGAQAPRLATVATDRRGST